MKPGKMRRIYLREAAIMLAAARLVARLVPVARLLVWAKRDLPRVRRFARHEVGWIVWAVETQGDRHRFKVPALPRALAAHQMLRRRNISSRLSLQIAGDRGGSITHAWVEVGTDVVVGEADNANFRGLQSAGGTRARPQ